MIKEYKEVEYLLKTFVKEYGDTWGNNVTKDVEMMVLLKFAERLKFC